MAIILKKPYQSVLCKAFTLVELLVSISVIGILLAITIPTLGEVFVIVKEHRTLDYQRHVMLELRGYVADHRGWFPYYGIPGTANAPLDYPPRLDNPSGVGTFDPDGLYWGQPLAWWWKLELEGYNGALARNGPEVDPEWDVQTRPYNAAALDWMTFAMFATPWYFENGRLPDARNHQPIAEHMIAYPAGKGILLRWNTVRRSASESKAKHFVQFADGHAEQRALGSMLPGVIVPSVTDGTPVLSTKDGVLGRDL